MTIEFLLRRATTNTAQREQIIKAVTHALIAMSHGGMYDVVGGDFSATVSIIFGEHLFLSNPVPAIFMKISTAYDSKIVASPCSRTQMIQ